MNTCLIILPTAVCNQCLFIFYCSQRLRQSHFIIFKFPRFRVISYTIQYTLPLLKSTDEFPNYLYKIEIVRTLL